MKYILITMILAISFNVRAEERTGWQMGIGWGLTGNSSLMDLEFASPKIFGYGQEIQHQVRLFANAGDSRVRGGSLNGATVIHNRLSAGFKISDAIGPVLPFLRVGYEKIFASGDLITNDSTGLLLGFGTDLIVTGRPNEDTAFYVQMDYRVGHPYNNTSGMEYFNGTALNVGFRFRH